MQTFSLLESIIAPVSFLICIALMVALQKTKAPCKNECAAREYRATMEEEIIT